MSSNPKGRLITPSAKLNAIAEAIFEVEFPAYSATADEDSNRWSWRGDAHGEGFKDTFRLYAGAALNAVQGLKNSQQNSAIEDVIASALCAQEEQAAKDGGEAWYGWSTDDLSAFIARQIAASSLDAFGGGLGG